MGDARTEPAGGRSWVAGNGGVPFDRGQLLAEYRFGDGANSFRLALYGPAPAQPK